MSVLDLRRLRDAFGAFMTGVTVVAARDASGAPAGFTANSYTSVSLSPPLLLVCPARALSSFAAFNTCAHFTVNILAESQREAANIFAAPQTDGAARFARVSWKEDEAGAPLLDGTAAFFSCAAHDRVLAGDHLILIGRVCNFGASGRAGLGYFNGGYFSLSMERQAAESASGMRPVAGAIVEYNGRILLRETADGMQPPQTPAGGGSPAEAVREWLDARGIAAEMGPAYSIFSHAGEHATYYRAAAKNADARGWGEYIAADKLSDARFPSAPLADMFRRYAAERQNGIFGLYIGGAQKGEVHALEGSAA
ncbi:MAG: flavin reductase family protein [Gammaproteobacteria bacterium]